MSLAYYPGCTLKTRARNLEEPAVASMEALGFKLDEVPRWNCCGTVYSLADDDLIHQVAPVRNLIRVKKQGKNEVVTLCAFCLNTLKRANLLMRQNVEKKDTLNRFIDEGIDYSGELKVVHLLEVLSDPQYTRGGSAPAKLAATAEFRLCITFYDRVFQLAGEGYPIAFTTPAPTFAEPSCTAIVAGAPNPDGAKKFMEFILSKGAQELAVTLGNYSVRPDMAPPKSAVPLKDIKVFQDDYK